MDDDLPSPRVIGYAALGAVGVLLMALILFWPGPFAPRDRIPFALIFGIPGVIALLQARWERRSAL